MLFVAHERFGCGSCHRSGHWSNSCLRIYRHSATGEEVCPANTASLDQKTLESVTKKLNNLVHQNNPDVNVRISDYSPYGEVYKVKVEFYNDNGTLESYYMFLTANGSLLFTNQIDLTRLSEEGVRKELT